MRILAVCLGNICRSPAAEAAIREAIPDVEVDSAGTGAWHIGNPPNPRMVAAGERAGLDVVGAARQVRVEDFDEFDLVLAMDHSNLESLEAMRPEGSRAEVRLFRTFDPDADSDEVPDPYYEPDDAAFDEVIVMVRAAAKGLANSL